MEDKIYNRKINQHYRNVIFIPARTGSTRVPNKNIQKIGGQTLLSRKIKTCLKADIGEVVVSTNCPKIKKYSEKLGAKCLFLRPKIYSTSRASTISAILHYLRFLKEKDENIPHSITICPATNPFLKSININLGYKKFINSKFNSLSAVTNPETHPFSFVKLTNKINYNIFKVNGFKWTDLERTQDWPEAFVACAALRITRSSYFMKYIDKKSPRFNKKTCDPNSTTFHKISNLESFDINEKFDIQLANFLNKKNKLKF
tara:strand:- start:245 stop:1021 length:777 start_codon:yes stop_codon:yes gene_type:complete